MAKKTKTKKPVKGAKEISRGELLANRAMDIRNCLIGLTIEEMLTLLNTVQMYYLTLYIVRHGDDKCS